MISEIFLNAFMNVSSNSLGIRSREVRYLIKISINVLLFLFNIPTTSSLSSLVLFYSILRHVNWSKFHSTCFTKTRSFSFIYYLIFYVFTETIRSLLRLTIQCINIILEVDLLIFLYFHFDLLLK